jgi:hypothetical protein
MFAQCDRYGGNMMHPQYGSDCTIIKDKQAGKLMPSAMQAAGEANPHCVTWDDARGLEHAKGDPSLAASFAAWSGIEGQGGPTILSRAPTSDEEEYNLPCVASKVPMPPPDARARGVDGALGGNTGAGRGSNVAAGNAYANSANGYGNDVNSYGGRVYSNGNQAGPSGFSRSGGRTITLEILEGSSNGYLNTNPSSVDARVGDTLEIVNRRRSGFIIHTSDGRPFIHPDPGEPPILPGSRRSYHLDRPTEASSLTYEHGTSGAQSRIRLNVQ